MNFLKKFKNLLRVIVLSAVTAMLVLPVSASANGPRFNYMSEDYKTLRGANRTDGEAEWKSSVSGDPGDEFRGIIYIHNGIQNTTAQNTRVKVTIPSHTVNKTATITATISADNAATVTDTLVVTLSSDADLEYLPGKTAWFPTRNGSASTEFPFPSGQSGDEIVSNGVNVGDVQGCFQFVQYVSFGFKSKAKNFPNISIEKNVRNVTAGEVSFVKSDNGRAGNVLEYKIDFKNTGAASADRIVIVDVLPAHISLIVGTTVISVNGSAEQKVGDTLTGDGIAFENLKAGGSGYIKFQAKISQDVPKDVCLVNKAKGFLNKVESESSAQTCVEKVASPEVGKALPVSGAGTPLAIGLITLMAGYSAYLMRIRKIRATAEYKIAKELLDK